MVTENIIIKGITITPLEYAVLQSIYFNYYGDLGSCTWAWAVNDSNKPSGITGKALSGVISSICKKGLYKANNVGTRDASLDSTKLGDSVLAVLFAGSK